MEGAEPLQIVPARVPGCSRAISAGQRADEDVHLGGRHVQRHAALRPQEARRQSPRRDDQNAQFDAGIPVPPHITTPADVAKIDIDPFERECAGELDKLRQTTLPIDEIEEYRALRVRHAQDACAFGLALLRGYSDPKALRTYSPASPLCDRFVDALEGKSDLDSAWKRLVDEGCADNASPQRCKARYEAEAARTDGAAHKRLYLIAFGWNNCAINSIAYNTDAGTTARQALRAKLSKAFVRTYRAKFVCEKP